MSDVLGAVEHLEQREQQTAVAFFRLEEQFKELSVEYGNAVSTVCRKRVWP